MADDASTVNAYYDPQMNNVNFPAGYLQPPFFSGKEDDAANYGDMGSTIGHELTHGFDDQGRQFDKDGNLKNWWTKDDERNFNDRADCMVKQYDAIEAVPGVHLNGKLTLGENLADLGGLWLAWLAWLDKAEAAHLDMNAKTTATRPISASGLRMRSSGVRRRVQSSCAARRRAIHTHRRVPDQHRADGLAGVCQELQLQEDGGDGGSPACRVW